MKNLIAELLVNLAQKEEEAKELTVPIPELFSNNRVIPAIIFSETFLLPPGNKGNAPII
jgi:hypothetical protein